MKAIKLLVPLLMLISLYGCATDWRQMASECRNFSQRFMWKSEHDLIIAYGPSKYPVQSDGAGGKILRFMYYGETDTRGDWDYLLTYYYLNKADMVYHIKCDMAD